jgi:hypothetical protein
MISKISQLATDSLDRPIMENAIYNTAAQRVVGSKVRDWSTIVIISSSATSVREIYGKLSGNALWPKMLANTQNRAHRLY